MVTEADANQNLIFSLITKSEVICKINDPNIKINDCYLYAIVDAKKH
jgi:hypothetical protein